MTHPLLGAVLIGLLATSLPLAAPGQPASAQPPYGGGDPLTRHEREDFGVAPASRLHAGPMHGPTPASIPGGQVITTQGLTALMQQRQVPFVVVDVLGQPMMLPGAVAAPWLSQPGSFDDAVQAQAGSWLGQLTQGRKDVALVFYCQSRECWMSYNAALRAIRAGHSNVLWYRGGIEAWAHAGLPTQGGAAGGFNAGPSAAAQPGVPQSGMQQQPGMQQPSMQQPGMAYPGTSQPGMGQPGMAYPGGSQPGMAQQGMPQPGMGYPGMSQPGVMHPGLAQQGMPRPGSAQAGMTQWPPSAAAGRNPSFTDVEAAAGGGPQPQYAQPRAAAPAAGGLSIQRGRFFAFALPDGWRVGEEGQYAVVLQAPDNRAMTVVVGNSGLPINYPPARYVQDKLAAMRVQNLSIGQPRAVQPASGLEQAFEFDISYVSGAGLPVQGVAKLSQSGAYDSKTMVVTAAFASADQWPQYGRWLPLVAEQISATDGAAFGRRGVMAQNLNNSVAFGNAAREYREWSQRNWQQVTDGRNASVDRRNFEFRENLGAVRTYSNPFGGTPPIELPTRNSYYWMDRQGRTFGTDDPGVDPNVGGTGEWRRMEMTPR
ncbi:MAG: rhodanese-like domain-containing protein [Lautropia sp.]